MKRVFILLTVFSSTTFINAQCLEFTPVHNSSGMIASNYDDNDKNEIVQVITPLENMNNVSVTLQLATNRNNGIVDPILDIIGVNSDGTPDTSTVYSTVSVDNSVVSHSNTGGGYGDVTFNFNFNLQANVSYGLRLRTSQGSGGIYWRRSSYPDDPLNPYSGGDLFEINFMMGSQEVMGNSNLDLQFKVCATSDILLNGTLSAENNQIKNVADPTDAQDAVTKSYVDSNINSFSGSYNDLTDKPAATYTQSEVDALISDLQDQIEALQATTGSGTVTDQDGNSYPYLTYGDQVWTVKNAEMVTYRDGTEIPQVTDATAWSNLTTGAWCYYDNDPSKGKLYNWYAVAGIHDNDDNTPNKEFAPEGWHVPSDAEWTTLEEYLISNGYNYDGSTTGNKIAKSMSSTTGWNSSTYTGAVGNNQSLNNSVGFNAFPGGFRDILGSFHFEGTDSRLWSSSESNTNVAWYRGLNVNSVNLASNGTSGSIRNGQSVRFIKD